jgi:hypothetical protein
MIISQRVDAVTEAKILDGVVTAGKLATNAVTTAKIKIVNLLDFKILTLGS